MSEKFKQGKNKSQELLKFIASSPSNYHVVENITDILKSKGFSQLFEKAEWTLIEGGKYYVVRNGSSVVAFTIPKLCQESCCGFRIVASHSDSPTFKIKENPEIIVEDKYFKLNTEKYGGMIMSTWLDRPLSVAGRIAYRDGEQIRTTNVCLDTDVCVIPNLAVHMNRDINKGFEYNAQTDMAPLFAGVGKKSTKDALLMAISDEAEIDKSFIIGSDLYLYVRDKGHFVGLNDEFIVSPKLDDLQCVFASVDAFKDCEVGDRINVCAVFDNEEVGSGTMQGADSTFLSDVLLRISEAMADNGSNYRQRLADSFLISADNAHAVHPNHPEKADPTNRPYLNGGVVIKYHGGQKYTTDGVSGAMIRCLCDKAKVPYQTYANKSDIAGGSTLGNISTSHVSIPSADVGLPQLAMHSAVETAGTQDTLYAVKMFKEFWS